MQVQLVDLVKDFGQTVAVDHVNLTIKDGALTGLLGPSGCGKSTTLYMISGLEQPTSGKILFDGEDVTEVPAEERGIGLVFQNYALYPHMTVQQNIMFPLVNAKVKKEEALARCMEMAKLVKVDDLLKRKPSQLSGGQQQRVAIARALVKQPKVLLLDEPLSNLDARLRLEMREEIRRIQKETGVTTIFVTHDQEEAMSITDEIVLMKKGVIQQQCFPQRMYLEPANQFVAGFLGNPPMNFVEVQAAQGMIRLNEVQYPVQEDISGTVLAGIRPESFMLGEELKVQVESVEIRGRDQLITFTLNDTPVHALIDSVHLVKAGAPISLAIKGKRIYLFDKETGRRLNKEFKYE